MRSKLQDLDALQENIRQETRGRAAQLQEALGVSEKFGRDYREAIRALSDIQDNLASQDSPGVDPATIKEQNKELEVQDLVLSVFKRLSETHFDSC